MSPVTISPDGVSGICPEMVTGDITEQTHQVFRNLKAVLKEANASLETVVKATVFLADMNQFAEVNETIFSEFFLFY